MNLLLLVMQGLELVSKEIVPIEELVGRIRSIFKLNPSVQVNVQNLSAEAIQADDDTLAMIAAWQTAHGLPVTVKPK